MQLRSKIEWRHKVERVKFISYVEQDEETGGWYIKLKDTFDGKEVICKDMEEYRKNIEEMGGEYGNDIDVEWKRSRKLTPHNIEDILNKMAELQKEYADEIDKLYGNQPEENEGNQNV